MDFIRRNTDYAIQAMMTVAGNGRQKPVSARMIAEERDISCQLTRKLMQKLQKAGLVKSRMGPAGGFLLSKDSSAISLLDIIRSIQGPVALNKCTSEDEGDTCIHQPDCPLSEQLKELQGYMEEFLSGITLFDITGKK